MRTLVFVHNNGPVQFTHLLKALAGRHRLILITAYPETIPGVEVIGYQARAPGAREPHLGRIGIETANGLAVAAVLERLKRTGTSPHAIVGHTNWGELLFVKGVFPDVPVIAYASFFCTGADTDFDPEHPPAGTEWISDRMKNLTLRAQLAEADAAVTPTRFQLSLQPPEYRDKIRLFHEGIDTEDFQPGPAAFRLPHGQVLTPGDEVVTYAAYGLEPHRGIHTFLRSLPTLLAERPNARVVIAGKPEAVHSRPRFGTSYRDLFLSGLEYDTGRVHFAGFLDGPAYRALLKVSAAHVYLSYPYVLSWSCLEAMATGCLVIGSDTAPVRDAIQHGENGLLTPFFDPDALAGNLARVLARPEEFAGLRANARASVKAHFSADAGTRGFCQLLGVALD